jgi:phosphoribosylanthranilate isomerase
LDSNTPGEGKRFDWNISAESIKSEKLILAGGLNVENLSAGIEKFSPFGVDVATGVESEPRRKDPELLKIFIETAKSFKAKTD